MNEELAYLLSFSRDRQQHLDEAKLSGPDPWMLATYAFDLQRRQNYLYMAHRMDTTLPLPRNWPQTPRQLLNVILNHDRFVADAARSARPYSSEDWEARARMLELIIRHQARQIWPDTHEVLTEIFGVEEDPGARLSGVDLPALPDMVDYVRDQESEAR